MFIVDVSPSMGKVREVEVEQPNGEIRTIEMTSLEWALQYVKLKVQAMVRYVSSSRLCQRANSCRLPSDL